MSEYFDPKDKKNKPILDYFEDKTWLLVDTNVNNRMAVRRILTQLNAKSSNIFDADNIIDAEKIITSRKPHFIVANKIVKNATTYHLFYQQLVCRPYRMKSGFFVLTEDTAHAEIAWNLEYEMDGILTLPLNGGALQDALIKGIKKKMITTPYLQKLDEGRAYYYNKIYDKALVSFNAAVALERSPYEAHAFIGQIYNDQNLLPEAIAAFEESVIHNTQYYKSLKRLSHIYFTGKEFKRAYEINQLMAQHFPIVAEQLADIIKLVVINKKPEDIAKYYKVFQTLPNLSLELHQNMAAGLTVLAKHYITNQETAKAIETLQAAFKLSHGKYEILKNITSSIQELKKPDVLLTWFDEVELTLWPKEVQGLYFHTLNLASKDDQAVLFYGEKLLKNNIHEFIIYKGLIERSIKAKRKLRTVEMLVLEAAKNFPKEAAELEILLQNSGLVN